MEERKKRRKKKTWGTFIDVVVNNVMYWEDPSGTTFTSKWTYEFESRFKQVKKNKIQENKKK